MLDDVMPSTATGYRGRFAPSPSGALHFGSLVAALGSWLAARAAGGRWLVRVEDIDPPRERPGAATDILATLEAFGMTSDEPVWFQSQRHDHYRAALQRLVDQGDAFPCACTRSDLAPSGIHLGACRRRAGPTAWRLRVPVETWRFTDGVAGAYAQSSQDVGDFVLWRADDLPAYQLAVVVDDAAQRISEVVRGSDLLESTPRQIHLQRRLGFATPGYRHLPLVLDAGGRKLSKSLASLPIDRMQPLPALRRALQVLGQSPQGDARGVAALLNGAVRAFDASRIPRTAVTLGAGDGVAGS
jgi:glutamyl-Q tRNA(Asp) synthetase